MTAIEPSIVNECLKSVSMTDNDTIEGVFVFPADFTAFEGHFPGQPVLPAVVQLAAVRMLAEKHLGHPLMPAGIHRAKFKSIIIPEMSMTIKIQLKQPDKTVTLSFTIDTGQSRAASGEIECRKPDA